MATIDTTEFDIETVSEESNNDTPINLNLKELLGPLASLKFSVGLFAAGIFLVLAGTLAQVKYDIWTVVETYFRCWFAYIPLQTFFPKTWLPGLQNIPGGFWFPGGWIIGSLMTINLLSAHAIRFKVQAKGERKLWGMGITLIGIFITWVVIEFGSARNGVFATAELDWTQYWNWICYGLLVPAIGCGIAASRHAQEKKYRAEFAVYAVLTLLFLGTSLYLIAGGKDVMLNNSAMRILWQLIQAILAGGILLGGCLLLFKKRAGIVLLHAGVLLLMANEVVVHSLHDEASMILLEGETTNFVRDIRSSELAIVDPSGDKTDHHVVVPDSILKKNADQDIDFKNKSEISNVHVISNEQLPFDLVVQKYYSNASIKKREPADENPATAGVGVNQSIVPIKTSTGTDSEVDYPAAYVDVIDKNKKKKIGTYLLSALLDSVDQSDLIKVDDKTYQISLRFKRNYKPYSIHLVDVRKDDYIGTTTPMNYSSEIRLVDHTKNEDRKIKIWMNNPLRFAGETFYQSGYNKIGEKEMTTLQVVTNEGWMIPYLACMIVAIGMLYQFGQTLIRFLNRAASGRLEGAQNRLTDSEDSTFEEAGNSPIYTGLNLGIPLLLFCICAYWLYGLSKPPVTASVEFDYYNFGKIPVVYQGRVKPIDTLARNAMRMLCNRESVRLEPVKKSEKSKNEPKQPMTISATQWLLELISGAEERLDRPIVRVENNELLSTLKLERRKSHRYTLRELQENISGLVEASEEARKKQQEAPESLSLYQRKVLEFENKLGVIDLLAASFISPSIDPGKGNMNEQIMMAMARVSRLDQRKPPLLIPPVEKITSEGLEKSLKRSEWEAYSKAFIYDLVYPVSFKTNPNPFSEKFTDILNTYDEGKPADFNSTVNQYRGLLKEHRIENVNLELLDFEAKFNNASPLFWPAFLYLFAFVLAIVGWLIPSLMTLLNRSALVLIFLTLIVHTFGLWARIEISGRPPVTNLYSAAVFIGWGGVLCGFIMELIFKRGIGIVLAAKTGFASLWLAHGLAGDGDTFTVLQAVLDTQFWLSTHVVIITLGYAATFVAGALGIIYVSKRNPLALLLVACAAGAAFGLKEFDRIPLMVRIVGPFLLAIPIAISPMYLFHGKPQLQLSKSLEKSLERMIYGTLCFALWFSFVGTVLGGLWADDSWGRFWGWDPKENGALIIVLWNALVIHARWDKLIKARGLAILAIAGNITTAWSFFGVNELGVGLHSYGFTDGALLYLSLFVFSQLALITIGLWGSSENAGGSPKSDSL